MGQGAFLLIDGGDSTKSSKHGWLVQLFLCLRVFNRLLKTTLRPNALVGPSNLDGAARVPILALTWTP